MRARNGNLMDGRLLTADELQDYLRIGRNNALAFGINAGAKICIGRRVLYDRVMIDKALDAMIELARVGAE